MIVFFKIFIVYIDDKIVFSFLSEENALIHIFLIGSQQQQENVT